MQITFLTRKFRNGERNLHCDVVHITTKWVSSLTLDCNGVFAIKAYARGSKDPTQSQGVNRHIACRGLHTSLNHSCVSPKMGCLKYNEHLHITNFQELVCDNVASNAALHSKNEEEEELRS